MKLTVKVPLWSEIVLRSSDGSSISIFRRFLPGSAGEFTLRFQVVLRLPHRRSLSSRRRVVCPPFADELTFHPKVVLMMVHRLPVDAFLVELLAIGGHRVHRLVPGDLEVILRQVVGTTMSSGQNKKINQSNKL